MTRGTTPDIWISDDPAFETGVPAGDLSVRYEIHHLWGSAIPDNPLWIGGRPHYQPCRVCGFRRLGCFDLPERDATWCAFAQSTYTAEQIARSRP